VLVACTQANILLFGPPDDAHIDHLVIMALFGDGAGAVVVGADPTGAVERPVFHTGAEPPLGRARAAALGPLGRAAEDILVRNPGRAHGGAPPP
jgi:3-oxoacyl-[acyl-carrier-protein] synthase III